MNRAYIESILSGISLPAERSELIAYAARQERGEPVATQLSRIPAGEYRTLQDVGEALEPRQPEAWKRDSPTKLPREESDVYPGGKSYLGESVQPLNVAALGESSDS